VRLAIQGLEVQRAALLAMRAGGSEAALAELAASSANTAASTMLWPWAVMQQAMSANAPAAAEPARRRHRKNERNSTRSRLK